MNKVKNISLAKNIAENTLRKNLMAYGVGKDDVIIENDAFIGDRFWVFFWNGNIKVSETDRNLADGWACAINDVGNLRLFYDFRKDAVKQNEILSGLRVWAAR